MQQSEELNWGVIGGPKCPNFETVTKGVRTQTILIVSAAFYRWATALPVAKLPDTDIKGCCAMVRLLYGIDDDECTGFSCVLRTFFYVISH